MTNVRKKMGSDFKAKVAFDALKGDKTMSELSTQYGVHNTQINNWKRLLKDDMPKIFLRKNDKKTRDKDSLIGDLYRQIGQLTCELEWLKKKIKLFDDRG